MEPNEELNDDAFDQSAFDKAFANIKITEDVINNLEISDDDKKILISMLNKSPEEIEKMLLQMIDRHLKSGTFFYNPQ